MPRDEVELNRRNFMKRVAGTGTTFTVAEAFGARPAVSARRIIGANDRINVAVIGLGGDQTGRGQYLTGHIQRLAEKTNSCRIAAVCDVYRKRVNLNKDAFKCDGYLDYREILGRKDIDAVVIATPDHHHAHIAMEALDSGKDAYVEKPMTHTIEQARQLIAAVRRTKGIVQVGAQTTSATQWQKIRQLISDGAIGPLIVSHGCYDRNYKGVDWLDRRPIDPNAGPSGTGEDYVDWKMWLGPAPQRPWDGDRFFRFRKYWDYSGGIATDLFFHLSAPLNICWGAAQFPSKVTSVGTHYIFEPGGIRSEVPNTFHLMAEYPKGHTLVLTSSMANVQHTPTMIRGQQGTLIMPGHLAFEGGIDHILLRPEEQVISDEYRAKFGAKEVSIPVDRQSREANWVTAHIANFLDCMRTRKAPALDVENAARTQVLVSMAVQSFREGRTLYFDENTWSVAAKPFRV